MKGIKCPKCEVENQIGAIFCRGCGDKLELDNVKPTTVKGKEKAKRSNYRLYIIVKNLILLSILLILILALVLFFMNPGMEDSEFTKLQKSEYADLYENMFQVNTADKLKKTLTESQLDYMVQQQTELLAELVEKSKEKDLDEGKTNFLIPVAISVKILDSEQIQFIIKHEFMDGLLSTYSLSVCELIIDEDSGLDIEVVKTKVGMLPSFLSSRGPLKALVLSRFKSALGNMVSVDDMKQITDFEFGRKGDKNTITFTRDRSKFTQKDLDRIKNNRSNK